MVDRSTKHREDLVSEARVLSLEVEGLAHRIDKEWFRRDVDGDLARHDLIVTLRNTAEGLMGCATELLVRSHREADG